MSYECKHMYFTASMEDIHRVRVSWHCEMAQISDIGRALRASLLPLIPHLPQRLEREAERDAEDDRAEMLPIGHGGPGTRHDRGLREKQDDDRENGPQMLDDIGEFNGYHDDEPTLASLGDCGKLLEGNVVRAQDVCPHLVRIERCCPSGELPFCIRLEAPEVRVIGLALGGGRKA